MIEALVCSGAGPNGLLQIGVIMEYERQGLFNRKNLNLVYGVSAGAIIGMMILLDIPLKVVIDYVVQRPWNKFTKIDFFDTNERGGVLECQKIKDMFSPLLLAYDVPLEITFAQLWERSKIDFHVFCTQIDTFKQVDFNHENSPHMPITAAVIMSCAVPPIFTTGSYDGVTYIDGGLTNNFPLADLLQHPSKPDPNNVLCVSMTGPKECFKNGSPLIDLMAYIMSQAFLKISEFHINHNTAKAKCKHYIYHDAASMFSKTLWEKFIYSAEERKRMVEFGCELGRIHLDKVNEGSIKEVSEA
jgi:predicted acylesterase/phospholipase RssA